jgi:exosortase
MLYFANASLEIADACSGIRSAVSFLTLGILMAYLSGSSLRASGKLFLVASTIPLALLVNVARVVGTGVLAAHFGTRAARGFLHEFSGFLVFALGFVMLWGLAGILRSFEGKRLEHLSQTSVLMEAD